jgi:hypothetical protein
MMEMNLNRHLNIGRNIKRNPSKNGFLLKKVKGLSTEFLGGIMYRVILTLLIVALPLFCACSPNDPDQMMQITISEISAANIEEVDVPITVQLFKNVSGLELHISYDTLQVNYNNAVANVLSNAVINESAGVIHIIWADYANQEISLNDGDTLILLQFADLVGESQLSFVGNNELVNKTGQKLDVDLIGGSVTPPVD